VKALFPTVVIPGRLTVPVYAPVELSTIELNVPGLLVTDPDRTSGIEVPAKDAAVITFPACVEKPLAETKTEVPAGPVEGVTVTVGAVIVKETAGGDVEASVISTLCEPTARFNPPAPPIMKVPESTPVALVESVELLTLVDKPSTVIVISPEVSLAAYPLPLTVTFVPLGPDVCTRLKVPVTA